MKTSTDSASNSGNVADFLLADEHAHAIALVTPDRQYTYSELQTATASIVDFLLGTGASRQDRVILLGENSFFWVAAYLATLRAGFVSVPLAASTSSRELEALLAITGARIALLQARFGVKHRQSFAGCHVLTDTDAAPLQGTTSQSSLAQLRLTHSRNRHAVSHAGGDDLAALMFTSGSTGRPRGVMVSHRNIIANTRSIVEYLGLTSDDRSMAVLPFHYCFGASLLHTHLRVGGSLVLERFTYPEIVLQQMVLTNCTGFAGVPSHFQILLRRTGLSGKSFPHLRFVQQAGGALAPALIRELQHALPHVKIFIMYGQTEGTARLSYLPPELLPTKLGSVGKGIPGVRLKVLDDTGAEIRPGEIGEIVAEGENVTRGYWLAPEDTSAVYRDGTLRTGDLATVDEEGFIYIVDRARKFLKCGGRRVSYQEVRNQILEFPCVLDTEVVAMRDDVLGEAVKLIVVPRMPGCSEFPSCFQSFCREHLPQEICPHEVAVVDRLPKTTAGKDAHNHPDSQDAAGGAPTSQYGRPLVETTRGNEDRRGRP